MNTPISLQSVGLYPRLFLAFVVIALIPLAASYMSQVSETRKETLALAHELIDQIASVQQRRLDLEFTHLADQLALVASRTQMRRSLDGFANTADPAERHLVERILEDLLASSEDLIGVWLLHADGRTRIGLPEVGPSIPDWQAGDPPLRFHWENGEARGMWLSGQLSLDDRDIGSVHVLSRLNRLRDGLDDFSRVAIGGRTLLILHDPQNGLITLSGTTRHALDTLLSAKLRNDQSPVSSIVLSRAPEIMVDDRLDLIYTYRGLGLVNTGALVYMRLEHLDETLSRQRIHLALDAAIAMALSILMAALLAKMISRPIHDLTQGTRRIQGGDLSARVTPRHWGEFALLTESFNATASALQQHTDALNSEIQTRQHAQHELISIANSDPLTGLHNRRYFIEALSQRVRDCNAGQRGGAILFIDLDGFKPVNDTYGHEAGDATLRIVAERLLHLVRGQDCVARLGGDEFIILLGEPAAPEDTEAIARRIDHALAEPIIHKTHRIQISGSIGIAQVEPGMSVEQILALGDSRMYQVKLAKRGDPSPRHDRNH